MTIDQKLDEIANMQYPHNVDVVDKVMSEVEQKPYLRPTSRIGNKPLFGSIAASFVAILVIGFGAGMLFGAFDNTDFSVAEGGDTPQWTTIEEQAAPIAAIQDSLQDR